MSSRPQFIVECGRFGINKIGNTLEPPMHGDMQTTQEWWGQATGAGVGGPPHDRLRLVGSWVGLDPVHVGARPRIGFWIGFCLGLWHSVARICFTLLELRLLLSFPLVFKCVSRKTCFLQYK
jgi:hypothetical protein